MAREPSAFGRALRFLVGAQTESPAVERAVTGINQIGMQVIGGRSSGQVARTDAAAFEAYERVPKLFSVTDLVANNVARAEWGVYRMKGSGEDSVVLKARKFHARLRSFETNGKAALRRTFIKQAISDGEIERLDYHPALAAWNRGNPELPSVEVRRVIQLNLDLVGRVAVVIQKGKKSELPVELWPVPMHCVTRMQNDLYEVKTGPFHWRNLKREELMFFRYPTPGNPYEGGVGAGTVLATEVDIDEHAATTANRRLANQYPNKLIMMEGVEDDNLRRLSAKLEAHAAQGKSGTPMLHNGTSMTIADLEETLADMGLLDLRRAQGDAIRETFGVPPEVLGQVENSNRATITASEYLFQSGAIDTRLSRQQDFLNTYLMPMFPESEDTLLLYESTIPEDREFASQVMSDHSSSFAVNEKRALIDLDPFDDQDELISSDFNGIQIEKATDAVILSATGQLSRESAKAILMQFFGLEDSRAEEMLGPIDFVPVQPNPEPDPLEDEEDDPEDEDPEDDDPEDLDDSKAVQVLVGGQRVQVRTKTKISAKAKKVAKQFTPNRMGDRLVRSWKGELEAWREYVTNEFDLELDPEELESAVASHLKNFKAKRVEGWSKTTQKRIARAVQDGIDRGLDSEEMVNLLQERVRSMLRGDAITIVTTEVQRSSSFVMEAAMKAAGVSEQRWLTQRDGDVRESHRTLDNQVIRVGREFETAGGAKARHPGGFGVAEEDINCRCRVIPNNDVRQRDFDMTWRDVDTQAGKWERRALAHLQNGYVQSMNAAIKILRKGS